MRVQWPVQLRDFLPTEFLISPDGLYYTVFTTLLAELQRRLPSALTGLDLLHDALRRNWIIITVEYRTVKMYGLIPRFHTTVRIARNALANNFRSYHAAGDFLHRLEQQLRPNIMTTFLITVKIYDQTNPPTIVATKLSNSAEFAKLFMHGFVGVK